MKFICNISWSGINKCWYTKPYRISRDRLPLSPGQDGAREGHGRQRDFADKETAIPVDLQGGVAVFCDPASYPADDLSFPPGWTMAVGIHTKKAHKTSEEEFQRMTSLIKRPGVAVGEVGSDRTAPFSE